MGVMIYWGDAGFISSTVQRLHVEGFQQYSGAE